MRREENIVNKFKGLFVYHDDSLSFLWDSVYEEIIKLLVAEQ